MTDRLPALKALAAKRPADPMVRYALGVEYRKRGEVGAALDAYLDAIRVDPGYTAAYVDAGELLAAQGRRDAAREIWTRGVLAAERKGALRTKLHLQRLLAALERGDFDQPEPRAPRAKRPRGRGRLSRPIGLGKGGDQPESPRKRFRS